MVGERFLTRDRSSEENELENPTPFNIRYLQNQVTETNDGSKDYETYANYLSANELQKPTETYDGFRDYETYTNYLSANELENPTPFNIRYLRNQVTETKNELNETSYEEFSPEYDIYDLKKDMQSSEVVGQRNNYEQMLEKKYCTIF